MKITDVVVSTEEYEESKKAEGNIDLRLCFQIIDQLCNRNV